MRRESDLRHALDETPGRLREDIESTRARLGDTLEELGTRFNPDRLKQEAKDTIHDATIGRVQHMARDTMQRANDAGRQVTDLIRENPIPAAMIGVGIGWLAWSAGRRDGSGQPRYTRPDIRRPYYEGDEQTYLPDVADESKIQSVAHTVTARAGDIASNVTERASDVAETVGDAARAQRVRVRDAFQEQPLVMGAIALAMGLAAGFLVPSTQVEGEMLGDKREALMDRARDVLEEKKDQAQHVAERVMSDVKSSASQAAREEGLTG
jgi:ElaB/YqjD/DUF883 family membrane-anchored ribosome-binding protein